MKFSGPKASDQARRYVLKKMIAMTGLRKSANWGRWNATLLDVLSEELHSDEDYNLVKRELKVAAADLRRLLAKT